MKTNKQIPSVNFHLWEPCNMKCKFCFATFNDVKQSKYPKGHLLKEDAIKIVKEIAKFGFEKITFAGGEPMLCPWLPELIKTAKINGLTTMIVTNGSKITDYFLESNADYLDWIAISIDSLKATTNQVLGRKINGYKSPSREFYLSIINKIKKYGYNLKINTVITSLNYEQDFNDFINHTNPERWKVLQVLPIKGQNDSEINSLKISKEQYDFFVNNHINIKNMITEKNSKMKGSYVMIDPSGRFFNNTKGYHQYSTPILNIGIKKAYNQMNYIYYKFVSRNGIYNWQK